MRFHQDTIDRIFIATETNVDPVKADKIEIILRDFREAAIRTGRQAGMADARARKVGGGPRKRR